MNDLVLALQRLKARNCLRLLGSKNSRFSSSSSFFNRTVAILVSSRLDSKKKIHLVSIRSGKQQYSRELQKNQQGRVHDGSFSDNK